MDLITVRGQKLLKEADVIIYAGSLVNPELLDFAKADCQIFDSAKMTLEQVIAKIEKAHQEGKTVVRFHTGDPCLYGAIREQMDEMDRLKIPYEICPGVSSFCGAAAALEMEYTLPGVSQSVVITRSPGHHGHFPQHRAVKGAGAGAFGRRVWTGYTGGHRIPGHLAG